MTKVINSRLHIHQCLKCLKICKGDSWKKHKTSTGHKLSWKRLFCSAHVKIVDAQFGNTDFISKHKDCNEQKVVSNPEFRSTILRRRKEIGDEGHISGEEYLDTDGEEEECLSISEDDEDSFSILDENELLTVLEETENDELSAEVTGEGREKTDETDQIEEVEKHGEEEEVEEQVKVGEIQKAGNLTQVSANNNIQKAAKEKKGEKVMRLSENKTARVKSKKSGIVRQSVAWEKDRKAEKISRMNFLEGVFERYKSLEARHKATVEELTRLKLVEGSAKTSKQELILAQEQSTCKARELGHAQGKIANLESRLNFTCEELKKVNDDNKRLKVELEKERDEKEKLKREAERKEMLRLCEDYQQLHLHIPCQKGSIKDDVLIYDLSEASDIECYAGTGVVCHHLTLTRRGRQYAIKSNNVRKRWCREELEEPEHQRERIN